MNPDQFHSCLLNEITFYVDKGTPCLHAAKQAAANDPTVMDVWLDPATDRVFVRRTYDSPYGAKIAGYETFYVPAARKEPEPTWCCLVLTRGKTASLTENLYGITGWNDRYYPPSPLAALLAGGVLGAGLGYGGASLASGFLPGDWDKRKFRRLGFLLGGGLGAAPGALETAKSLLIGQPVTDGSHLKLPKQESSEKTTNWSQQGLPYAPRYATGPTIDSEAMLNTVWRSPMGSGRLSPKEQVVASDSKTNRYTAPKGKVEVRT